MKILILCPGTIPDCKSEISSFFSCTNFYIPKALTKFCDCVIKEIPEANENNFREIKNFFLTQDFDSFDAIIALGLRYFSFIPSEIKQIIRARFNGLICQLYDGARIKDDGIDFTLTMKNDYWRTFIRHWYRLKKGHNIYVGWGADEQLNCPKQDADTLGILIDHPDEFREGRGVADKTNEIIKDVERLRISNNWNKYYKKLSVRRFSADYGVENLDFNKIETKLYKGHRNSNIPYPKICEEHCKTHVFIVTHPESLGLVVLETALAGALVVAPKGFVAKDRLKTIKHYEYKKHIDWEKVLRMVNIKESRKIALKNSWDRVAENIVAALTKKI